MKKTYLIVRLLTALMATSTISLRLLAQDCTGQSNCNNRIINTKENNLEEILIAQKSPIPLKNSSQGITSSTSPSKSSSPSSKLSPKGTAVNSQEWSSSLPLVFSLLGIVSGIGGVVFIVLALNHHKKLLDRQNNKMADLENKSSLSSQKITKNFEVYDLTTTQKLNAISRQIQELHSKYEALQEEVKQVNNLSLASALDPVSISYTVSEPTISLQDLDEVISKFNSQDINYFNTLPFTPVRLTQESIQNRLKSNIKAILQVERTLDPSQAQYLQFSIEDWHWLIPNITSPYFNQVLDSLQKYPEIFSTLSQSGNHELIRPAKLKPNWFLWDIIEQGEMRSQKSTSQPIDAIILSSNYSSNPSPVAQNKKEIDTIISKFNNKEINYFRQTRFRPVKSRFNSSNIVVNIHDRRMIWIESSKSEQATYLLFELEGKDWLIPNITVQNFDQILSQLAKNLEIFIFPLGKENASVTSLLKPAQVKFVNHEVWEIIELGEFTQINSEHQTPHITIQHQNNQSNAELAILTYLKKHGDATYNQLRLSIECEEEILRQSLIKLDKEDYITVEISQDHNVIYKVG